MDVVVLAGGFGTRLRPLTEGRVKPLLRILDKTLLERVVEVVPEEMVDRVVVAAGYGIEEMRNWAENTDLPYEIVLSVEEEAEIEIIHVEDTPKFTDVETDLKIGKPLEFDETEEYSFSQWLALTKVKKIDRSEKKTEESDLINSFIESNPTIKAEKNKFFSPTETAKTSLVENNELVTETLARVYLEQQHFEKAIEAYKKLSLKYPKKSSFFADQINLINDLKKK